MDLATRKMVYYGLLGLLLAGSTIAVFRIAPRMVPILSKYGTVAVYFDDIPSEIQFDQSGSSLAAPAPGVGPTQGQFVPTSVNVTVDSISFHDDRSNDSGWTIHSLSSPVKIDLLEKNSVSTLIGSVHIPAENVTMVVMHVSSAIASVTINGVRSTSPVSVSVPSNTLKIPMDFGARVDPQRTTTVVGDRPHIIVTGNNMIKVTPVLQVASIRGPQ